MKLVNFNVGENKPFFLIAGPCVIESEALILDTAGKLKEKDVMYWFPIIEIILIFTQFNIFISF